MQKNQSQKPVSDKTERTSPKKNQSQKKSPVRKLLIRSKLQFRPQLKQQKPQQQPQPLQQQPRRKQLSVQSLQN